MTRRSGEEGKGKLQSIAERGVEFAVKADETIQTLRDRVSAAKAFRKFGLSPLLAITGEYDPKMRELSSRSADSSDRVVLSWSPSGKEYAEGLGKISIKRKRMCKKGDENSVLLSSELTCELGDGSHSLNNARLEIQSEESANKGNGDVKLIQMRLSNDDAINPGASSRSLYDIVYFVNGVVDEKRSYRSYTGEIDGEALDTAVSGCIDDSFLADETISRLIFPIFNIPKLIKQFATVPFGHANDLDDSSDVKKISEQLLPLTY